MFGLLRVATLFNQLAVCTVVIAVAQLSSVAPADAADEPPGVGAVGETASPDILSAYDAEATQRLRFDVGDRVFFAPGSAELGSRARMVLSRQAQWLSAWKASVVIAGHADEGGAVENDERVSFKRAEAVRDRLLEEGIAGDRLKIVGLGRQDPIADCPEPACGAQNRRVIVHVMTTDTGSDLQR